MATRATILAVLLVMGAMHAHGLDVHVSLGSTEGALLFDGARVTGQTPASDFSINTAASTCSPQWFTLDTDTGSLSSSGSLNDISSQGDDYSCSLTLDFILAEAQQPSSQELTIIVNSTYGYTFSAFPDVHFALPIDPDLVLATVAAQGNGPTDVPVSFNLLSESAGFSINAESGELYATESWLNCAEQYYELEIQAYNPNVPSIESRITVHVRAGQGSLQQLNSACLSCIA